MRAGALVTASAIGALLSTPGPAVRRAESNVRRLDLGRLVITLSSSRTAQTFHIVDQLADWNPYAHHAYQRWAAKGSVLDDADRKALARHGEMRKVPSKAGGFENAFLAEGSLTDAASAAVRDHWLTP